MLKQCTILTAKQDFSFKIKGRKAVVVRTGQQFWVTSSVTMQANGYVTIDRKGKGSISQGYSFTPDQINQLFDTEV